MREIRLQALVEAKDVATAESVLYSARCEGSVHILKYDSNDGSTYEELSERFEIDCLIVHTYSFHTLYPGSSRWIGPNVSPWKGNKPYVVVSPGWFNGQEADPDVRVEIERVRSRNPSLTYQESLVRASVRAAIYLRALRAVASREGFDSIAQFGLVFNDWKGMRTNDYGRARWARSNLRDWVSAFNKLRKQLLNGEVVSMPPFVESKIVPWLYDRHWEDNYT